jgi:hypothetical protein
MLHISPESFCVTLFAIISSNFYFVKNNILVLKCNTCSPHGIRIIRFLRF